ncbi:MAG: LysE family translocator [Oligoflexia bacterium]|nr:LysE family translocator [Oligoflexia bacterium]
MLDLVFTLLPFSLSTTITPGPNNIMVTASGVNFGYRKTIPHILGVTVGLPLMMIVIGFGLGSVFKMYPVIHLVLKYVGAAYLLFLAWKIATFHQKENGSSKSKPFSFWQGLVFQWVNPKAWMMAIGAVSTFTTPKGNVYAEVLLIATVFFLICYPSMTVWTLLGINIRRLLSTDFYRTAFNITMALLLASSLILTL